MAELPAVDFVDEDDYAGHRNVAGMTLAQLADGDADVAQAA